MTSGLERNIHIKNYINSLFAEEDPILTAVRERSKAAGFPNIHVPSTVGKLLYCLAKIQRPQRILELGTLGGYSTIWLARALSPEGRMISIDRIPLHVSVSRENVRHAGLQDQVEVREGDASDMLIEMAANQEKPFDLIFIDANKDDYPLYLNLILPLTRSGTLILSDNLIPKEQEIGNPAPNDVEAQGIYQFNERIAKDPLFESILATTIVGEKGRVDALGISIVK